MVDRVKSYIKETQNEEPRSTFVRVPRGADCTIFGGWGPRL